MKGQIWRRLTAAAVAALAVGLVVVLLVEKPSQHGVGNGPADEKQPAAKDPVALLAEAERMTDDLGDVVDFGGKAAPDGTPPGIVPVDNARSEQKSNVPIPIGSPVHLSPEAGDANGDGALFPWEQPRIATPRTPRVKSVPTIRHGPDGTEYAVWRGIRWLADHQFPDGHWSFQFSAGHPSKDCTCTESGRRQSDTQATALGALSFLATGTTQREGSKKKHVADALRWLMKRMDEKTGQIAGPGEGEDMVSHALALITICEAFDMCNDRSLAPYCDKGINFTIAARHPKEGGWARRPGEHANLAVTAWQIIAIRSAQLAGIKVPKASIAGSIDFINRCETAPGSGIFSYQQDCLQSPDATAMGLLCRLYLEGVRGPGLEAGSSWLWEEWRTGRAPLSPEGILCGLLLLRQMPSHVCPASYDEVRMVRLALADREERHEHVAGSWRPQTREERIGGRLYATTMGVLAIATHDGYLPFTKHRGLAED